jgi:predicted nucleic acid-binding protein
MIVVSDTSPVTALITIGKVELLRGLFAEILIPESVRAELLRSHSSLPEWLQTRHVSNANAVADFAKLVDPGEAEAIALAKELNADHLLIDERKGRRLAQAEGIRVIGLVGIVLLAKRKALVPNARGLLEQLVNEAGVYLDHELINSALKSVGE